MRWLALLAVAIIGALVAAYRYEDPFMRRWPSPRERAAAERLRAMHDQFCER